MKKTALFGALALVSGAFAAPIPIQGYMLDISRSKVPEMRALHRMVDVLAKLGYNQFQLYTEHTFAYKGHEAAWRTASPMTPAEIRDLDAYCASKGIELVPNQNSFGHLGEWLRHPDYNDLAECPQGGAIYKKWRSVFPRPEAICPTDPRSLDFVAGLYDQLFPCFRSHLVNVGCDETLELFNDNEPRIGRSAAIVAKKSAPRVYFDFLKGIYGLVAERGHKMMFWGDIVLRHPELVDDLPKDLICLNWGYEANHPFESQASVFEKSGRTFYVCPGTSTWSAPSGRTTNMLGNIDNALAAGERHGAAGVLLTDWGDHGHMQPWISSLPALVYLSHRRKGETMTRDQLAAAIDRLVGAKCGRALIRLGDAYLKVGGRMGNTSELSFLLREGKDYVRGKGVTDETLAAGMAEWRAAMAERDLTGAPDWVKDGFAVLDLLEEAINRRIADPAAKNFRAMFEPRYRALWLKHNRPGGLDRSLETVFSK